jgi:hypothetical protein
VRKRFPSFLSIFLTTSPSFIPLNLPPHYLSSLSCNIIIHLITSVFLPWKEYKEKDREDGGRMVKRRWRGRRDTRGSEEEI